VSLLKWLFGFPGYLWPWPTLYWSLSLLSWRYFTPAIEEMRSFRVAWVAPIVLWNLTALVLVAGAWQLRFYTQRAQGTQYKYNSRWPSADSPTFLLKDQFRDNAFWNLCSAVPIWSVYEVLTFWLQANGLAPVLDCKTHIVYTVLLFLLTPMWIVVHFYATHRLLHWPPLYKSVHYIHHKNVNVGPWSGLAMHPAEHLIFYSAVVLFWMIPACPLHAVYLLTTLSLSAPEGHLGFDALVWRKRKFAPVSDYMHYLHHKYVTVNYGNALVPLDKWLGTFHDGSDEATQALKMKMRERA